MRHRPLDSLLLAGVGTLAVHEIAYLPGSVGATVAHDHLPIMWGAGGVVAVAVLLRAVVGALRSRSGRRTIDPVVLSAAIAAFFVVQESLEYAFAGSPAIDVLSQGLIWLGLAAAPVVGWALARLVNGITELAATSVEPRPGFVSGDRPLTWSAVAAAEQLSLVFLRHSMARRGPPTLSF